MRSLPHSASFSADEQVRELAAIFASGILRLHPTLLSQGRGPSSPGFCLGLTLRTSSWLLMCSNAQSVRRPAVDVPNGT